jgi:hypothetical protein
MRSLALDKKNYRDQLENFGPGPGPGKIKILVPVPDPVPVKSKILVPVPDPVPPGPGPGPGPGPLCRSLIIFERKYCFSDLICDTMKQYSGHNGCYHNLLPSD